MNNSSIITEETKKRIANTFLEKRATGEELSKQYGVSRMSIWRWSKMYGLTEGLDPVAIPEERKESEKNVKPKVTSSERKNDNRLSRLELELKLKEAERKLVEMKCLLILVQTQHRGMTALVKTANSLTKLPKKEIPHSLNSLNKTSQYDAIKYTVSR